MKKNLFLTQTLIFIITVGMAVAACRSSPSPSSSATTIEEFTDINGYYVQANGSDFNTGISERVPFRTLAKAVEEASKTTVKRIIVIGTISGNTVLNDTGTETIIITGMSDAYENEKAVITGSGFRNLLDISGISKIQLENITLLGEQKDSRGIIIRSSSTVTLGKNTRISNFNMGDGAGIWLEGNLFMTDNAVITDNTANNGGGLIIIGGKAIMQDDASIANNTSLIIREANGGGGVLIANGGTLTMQDNSSISGNKAVNGGGVVINAGTLVMEDNAKIMDNEANVGDNSSLYGGGGIYLSLNGSVEIKGNSSVTGNRAANGPDVYEWN